MNEVRVELDPIHLLANEIYAERLRVRTAVAKRKSPAPTGSHGNGGPSPRLAGTAAGVVLVEIGTNALGLRTLTELRPEDAAAIAASEQFAGASLTPMGLTEVRDAQETLHGGGTVVTEPFTYDGHVWVAALTETSAEGWAVGVAMRADQITAQLRITSLVFLGFGLFMVIYIALAVFFLRRSVLQPLAELVAGSERITVGDFDTAVPVHGEGEVARLATSFNSMATQIRDNTARLESQVATRTAALERANHEIMELSLKDQLTDSYNRRYLEAFLPQALRRMQRHDLPMSIVMVDIDHFKTVNDTYGHQAGDLVLAEFAACVRQQAPDPDWVVRYGGEEFMVVLLEMDLDTAMAVAEHLRQQVGAMHLDVSSGQSVQITASFGVATALPEETVPEVITRADRALYDAKAAGRNTVRSR